MEALDIPRNLNVMANKLCEMDCHQSALDLYVLAFEIIPGLRICLEQEFRYLLWLQTNKLSRDNRKMEMFENFLKAMRTFHDNSAIINDVGKWLVAYGYHSEALYCFEGALKNDRNNVDAEKNSDNTKRCLFPKQQFRILNDRIKNEAYLLALRSTITPGRDSVMNIDAGVGVLALYAEECDPNKTNACEASNVAFKLAERIFEENHVDIMLVNAQTTVLSPYDLYNTPDVLLTDGIDSGLIGGDILQSLSHAMVNLAQGPFRVIPGRAEYFVAGVKCDALNQQYQLCESTKRMLNIPDLNVHRLRPNTQSYSSVDVHSYDAKYICETQSVFKIDFNNYDDVQKMLHGTCPLNVEFTAKESGDMNAVVGWFDLHLTDDVVITSNPRLEGRVSGWQQAVFCDVLPRKLKENETVNLEFMTHGGRLTCLTDTSTKITRISEETLKFLNDTEYLKEIAACIGTACVYLGQIVNMSECDIVDLNPFPVFGLRMMSRGANTLTCYAHTEDDKAFLETVLRANNIELDKVTILVSKYWDNAVFRRKKFHAIFMNVISQNGDVNNERVKMATHLKGCLHEDGLFLPHQVSIIGQLVHSGWLEKNNRVIDRNVGFEIEKHVNRFRVSKEVNIDVARLEYDPLSSPIVIAESCTEMDSAMLQIPVVNEGVCSALLCWYRVQLLEGWKEVPTGRGNSFVDSIAFMLDRNVTMHCGEEVNVLRIVDLDEGFKLRVDVKK